MPKVGEKFQFDGWTIDKNCPLCQLISAACHIDDFFQKDYYLGFEVVEVGEFITVKFSTTKIQVSFPAKYWSNMTFNYEYH